MECSVNYIIIWCSFPVWPQLACRLVGSNSERSSNYGIIYRTLHGKSNLIIHYIADFLTWLIKEELDWKWDLSLYLWLKEWPQPNESVVEDMQQFNVSFYWLIKTRFSSNFSSIALELNLKNDRQIYLSHRQSANRVKILLKVCEGSLPC